MERVGASIAVPGKPNEAYLFSGLNYVKIDVVKDKIMYGPAKIADEWPGIGKAGFKTVDAALQVPESSAKLSGETYFFCGDQYARVQVIASKPDVLQWGPKKWQDYWKSLDWITPNNPLIEPPPTGGTKPPPGGNTDNGQSQSKPLIGPRKFSQSPLKPPGIQFGKASFNHDRNFAVTCIELWTGFWYNNKCMSIRKVKLTWEDGHQAVIGTDIRAANHHVLRLDPRGGERVTKWDVRLSQVWNWVNIATNKGQTLTVGGPDGNPSYYHVGNGVLVGMAGTCWPPEITYDAWPIWGNSGN